MSDLDVLNSALDSSDAETLVTSLRQSRALAHAVKAAVRLGWAVSANDGVNRAVREELEAFARRVALAEHLDAHPEARPELAEVAIALAEIRHDALADHPDLIRRAAAELVAVKADAGPDDVLIWALSRRSKPRRTA